MAKVVARKETGKLVIDFTYRGVRCREQTALEDAAHSAIELRFHALGHSNAERLLHITFTLRRSGQFIRVISAPDMHRKERTVYEHASQ